MSGKSRTRTAARLKRKRRIRKKVAGTAEVPRLSVFRSHRLIYAQVVNDDEGKTLIAADVKRAAEVDVPEGVGGKCAEAYRVGRAVADQAKAQGIEKIVFDRSGYLYHGRVAALARGVRDGGIKF